MTFDLSEETRVWLAGDRQETADPATQRLELSLGEASFDVPLDEVRTLWLELLPRSEESL